MRAPHATVSVNNNCDFVICVLTLSFPLILMVPSPLTKSHLQSVGIVLTAHIQNLHLRYLVLICELLEPMAYVMVYIPHSRQSS